MIGGLSLLRLSVVPWDCGQHELGVSLLVLDQGAQELAEFRV